jgi:hypothetical protein
MTCSQCDSTGISVPKSSRLVDGKWIDTHYPERAKTCPLCDGTGDKVRTWAFSCGTEYADWKYRNCDSCAHRFVESEKHPMTPVEWRAQWRCDLEFELGSAAMTNGTVPLDIHRRLGLDGERGSRCTEFQEDYRHAL